MANTPQAKKRIRRNTARTIVNKNRVSRIRTLVKKVDRPDCTIRVIVPPHSHCSPSRP